MKKPDYIPEFYAEQYTNGNIHLYISYRAVFDNYIMYVFERRKEFVDFIKNSIYMIKTEQIYTYK